MPNIREIKDSKFLRQDDCEPAILVTITGCDQENVAKQGAEQELRWCLRFEEIEKPLVLNSTNAQIIAQITGFDDTDHWVGKKIVLYKDPNITFGGKLVGGIRARAPKNRPPQAPPRSPAPPPNPRPPAPRHQAPPAQQDDQYDEPRHDYGETIPF